MKFLEKKLENKSFLELQWKYTHTHLSNIIQFEYTYPHIKFHISTYTNPHIQISHFTFTSNNNYLKNRQNNQA